MKKNKKIKVAIVGIGNCASSLLQGIEHYSSIPKNHPDRLVGLMHADLGGYTADDIDVVAGFDIDKRKVGKPLNTAIFERPNCTKQVVAKTKRFKAVVQMGEVLDGVASHMEDYPYDKRFVVADRKPCDVADILRKSGAEVLVNYLPVGSENAVRFYAEAALEAGVGMVNCVPVFIASEHEWAKRFAVAGVPIIGDDIKSQVGATIIHRALTKLFADRGVKIDNTYQLNVGGNTDFLNMLNKRRLASKKISKTEAVRSQMNESIADGNIHIGPSDYIPWLDDNKVCFLRIEGRGFADVPMNVELRLSVEDSPNSAGVVIDAIRCAKLAIDRGVGGVLHSPSAYFMKHPSVQFSDDEARIMVEEFIAGKREN